MHSGSITLAMIKPKSLSRKPNKTSDAKKIHARILSWYDKHRRSFPWRAQPGSIPDPYSIWLSEIMLQQTTVVTVKDYYQNFVTRWPSIRDLAQAPLEEVLAAWAGLGYYARARNLHACARQIYEHNHGLFPESEDELRMLPGIGPYTAAAISAIAFDRPSVAVDGNVERIITRLHTIEAPPKKNKKIIIEKSQLLASSVRPGDFAQALMDLGSTVCTPKNPQCRVCPIKGYCLAFQQNKMHLYPLKEKKQKKPTRQAAIFILTSDRNILIQKQPNHGIFGGMFIFPSTPFNQNTKLEAILDHAPHKIKWRKLDGLIKHIFTHFVCESHVFIGKTRSNIKLGLDKKWISLEELPKTGLPTLMMKAAEKANLLN